MLKLVDDNTPKADLTPIRDSFERLFGNKHAFAEFIVHFMLDPYEIADTFDGDTVDEVYRLAVEETERMLDCPDGVWDISEVFDETFFQLAEE